MPNANHNILWYTKQPLRPLPHASFSDLSCTVTPKLQHYKQVLVAARARRMFKAFLCLRYTLNAPKSKVLLLKASISSHNSTARPASISLCLFGGCGSQRLLRIPAPCNNILHHQRNQKLSMSDLHSLIQKAGFIKKNLKKVKSRVYAKIWKSMKIYPTKMKKKIKEMNY
eukprot:NODE_68_length_23780_cov_0.251003.p8 type:complete len:170 gc:universal NODE_68_length_23780_cov_0.251003:15051-15560(+)